LFAAVLFGSGLFTAGMSRAQDDLQGRLLHRGDGALFIYKDGFKYAIQSVQLSDDLINAIPDGTPGSLDQLFAQPQAPASPAVQTQPPPSPSGLVPVGSGISVVVPQGYTVASTSTGQVDLDKATQVTAAPFVTSRLQGNSIQNFHGALIAVARPDVAVSLFFISRSSSDENAAVESMLASLEQ
jgi:hypothetical protein